MYKNINTALCHLKDFAPFKDPTNSSHFPIYNTATFDLKNQSGDKIYDYTRSDNPTREALENFFSFAENGAGTVCTHTGIASVALLFETTLKANSTILVEADCYGGTFRLLKIFKEKYNIEVIFTDFSDFQMLEHILKTSNVDLTLCESPTNPGLKIIDLEKVAKLCKKYNSLFAVDNSLATFISQKPLDLGADFSLFSTTKYISGHGSVIAGAIVAKTKENSDKLHYYSNAHGHNQNPLDVHLISLGVPSLKIRAKASSRNSIKLAKFLEKQDFIEKVTHPALKSHKNRNLAKRQMKIIPGLFCADFKSVEVAEKFIANSKIFGEKCSFGSPDSRVEIPSKISHASFSKEELKAIGISDCTVRFAIGFESFEDLKEDLLQAIR
ncbi:aminotransferase class I/II-fold pyridoxal phosphate-dependent enzyme [Aliarcobacter trophiarum]|uniref:aminotransferase class I/II-fold pyridoxal phosphate-dependent enzyme n=1 Tax=Aliarcobacter trophiarum TaxID=708186 RepID=UPI00100AF500|nr:aminotransferase class I/II-fold pyridoxal phosphate-dependent enzyme [Aliarcobacter trophiarum]RXI27834.1 cystathionine gamma-synthase [Aliarcobacter trophiarum]